ncbi:type I restriction-modification system endonuclease [Rummeliibacillus pycnus]|uniref:type I restriction-modification system endonuclease n=1 Tax=Rummeliibacillus pycnus TaxID=101070 RepID=UPI0037C55D65
MNSNFMFFTGQWTVLKNLGESAEKNIYRDPHTTIMKLRLLGETIAKFILAAENVTEPYQAKQVDRINIMRREGIAEAELIEIFETLRRKGNYAMHEAGYGSSIEAEALVQLAFRLSIWFMEVYVDWDFQTPTYHKPDPVPDEEKLRHQFELQLKALEAEYAEKEKELEQQLVKVASNAETEAPENKKERKRKSKLFINKHQLSEAETRTIIDEQLRAAKWEVDTEQLNYQKHKTVPQKNRNMAIAEWPTKHGRADYALFIGLKLVGIIEAKPQRKNIPASLDSQAKVYAKNLSKVDDEEFLPVKGEYQVPFIYATNGRPYLKQLADASGIWFWDARTPHKHAHPLEGWHSPADLQLLLDQDDSESTELLNAMDINKFGLRYYQQKAVLAAEQTINVGQRKMLIAMATGTGKTRTAIALMYRLIASKKARRILFLVDRNPLGQQTIDSLKDTKIEGLAFSDIYNISELANMPPEVETRVHIATVQSMVRRVYYNNGEDMPTVGQYDFIIVDEAHRGYTGDREMTEEELLFTDQNDYVSQYRRVIDYFDATVLGLTATPALHTTKIFGMPIYKYSYSEAVMDGYLVDHEPPYLFKTKLSEDGISFKKNEEVEAYDAATGQIVLEKMEDNLRFDVEQFNKRVITESFNKAILDELTNYIDPESKEKTLIFAATDHHADLIVRLLKQSYEERGDVVDDDAIVKITGSIYKPNEAIKKFKNENMPNIVVTVDLLTTGIDVPAISNIVFLRRVQSRILYDQMLGRATRLCPEIGKTHFNIFDAVGIYDKLQAYTEMKPVVKKQNQTIEQLSDDFQNAQTEEEAAYFREQLVAKIQRRKQKLDDEGKRKFEELSHGITIDAWAQDIKSYTPQQAQNNSLLFQYLSEYRITGEKQYISHQVDYVKPVERGYGKGNERPQDFLNGFVDYIKNNINKIPALQIICSRPKDLTRDDLRSLVTILETKGFKESHLQTAWKQTKNEDIAADIISFIRQAALGEALVDHETRVKNAMNKVMSLHNWNPRQKKWLDRIEKQLLQVPVLALNPKEAFQEEPFASKGGYKIMHREFGESIDSIVETINDNLYA